MAEVVKHLKGANSRRVRRECWDSVKSKLWGEAFWSGGYFYRSVGSTTSEAIQYHIERSQGKALDRPGLRRVQPQKEHADNDKAVHSTALSASIG